MAACEKQVDFCINQPVLSVFGYLATLPRIADIRVDYVDHQKFMIHLSCPLGITSWGEDLTISFYDPMNGGTRIIASSKSKVPTTLIDYGKNKKNVESIQQYIRSLYGC